MIVVYLYCRVFVFVKHCLRFIGTQVLTSLCNVCFVVYSCGVSSPVVMVVLF